ncbi:DNA primase domain protein [Myxococcus hansupus]|uniref:DNA primase domain protein n=1 Tax=Pseudomyxococcus hansupus TaxID=1297742 RepID=A0A0H4WU83_9BACT|nr:hypothetical protein [Myxococcus hansupus]AKQ65133.1 DNA primase domain protein [Myxococcus hansupus]
MSCTLAAVLELFRASFATTDSQEGTEHLCEQARLKLRRHRERRKACDAGRLADNKAHWEALSGSAPAAPLTDSPGQEEDAPDLDAWGKELVLDTTKEGGKRIKNCEANVFTVLLSSPEWHGVLRFN